MRLNMKIDCRVCLFVFPGDVSSVPAGRGKRCPVLNVLYKDASTSVSRRAWPVVQRDKA